MEHRRLPLPPVAAAAAIALTALAPSSARGAGDRMSEEPQVEVVRDDAPVAAERTFPRRILVSGSIGGLLPLAGPMAELGNAGAGAGLAVGWHFAPRFALVLELAAGQIPEPGTEDLARMLATGWLGLRGTLVLDEALTLFAELGGGAVLTTRQGHATPRLAGAEPVGALGGGAGIELDLMNRLSAEGGARFDVLFTEHAWGGTSVLAWPHVSLTLHL